MASSQLQLNPRQILIKPLEGKENWLTWKCKLMTLLKMNEGSFEVVDGKLEKPVVDETKSAAEQATAKTNLKSFTDAEKYAMQLFLQTLGEAVYEKVMTCA